MRRIRSQMSLFGLTLQAQSEQRRSEKIAAIGLVVAFLIIFAMVLIQIWL